MIAFSRKAAEGNSASTAALRRVGISLRSQRRALRHPAGALVKQTGSATQMKGIREEVMNGTLHHYGAGGQEKAIGVSHR